VEANAFFFKDFEVGFMDDEHFWICFDGRERNHLLKSSSLFVRVNVFIGLIDLFLDLIMLILGRLLEQE